MICQHCGAEIPDTCKFCTSCGTEVTPKKPEYPTHDFARVPIQVPTCKLDFGKLLGDTFELYQRHFGTFCLVGLLLAGIPGIFYVGALLSHMAAQLTAMTGGHVSLVLLFGGLYFCMMILFTLTLWYLTLGTIRQSLYIARGGRGFQTNLMFPPLMPYLKISGLYFLVGCLCTALMLLSWLPAVVTFLITGTLAANAGFANDAIPIGMIVAMFVGGLFYFLGLCAAIWIAIRLYLAQFLVADTETGIIASMTQSWRISRGNFWMLLLAVFVLNFLAMLGFFLCGIGIIFTIALSWLGTSLAYMRLTGQPNCLDYPPPDRRQTA